MNKSYLGLDCGATKSEVVLTDKKNILTSKIYFGVNMNIIDFDEAIRRLVFMINDTSKGNFSNIISITAGIAGAREKKIKENIKNVLAKLTGFDKISIYSDTEIAFASFFKDTEKKCGILIAGTGSILYYKDDKGKFNRIGGWGRTIDDEGSGYWIGKEALSRVTKFYDNREKKTMLTSLIKKKYGIDKDNLLKIVYKDNFEIPKLAKDVIEAANRGDIVSKDIINEAAMKLANHFEPFKKLKSKIMLTGSLFTGNSFLEKSLKKIVKAKYKNIDLKKGDKRPIWGAIQLAINN